MRQKAVEGEACSTDSLGENYAAEWDGVFAPKFPHLLQKLLIHDRVARSYRARIGPPFIIRIPKSIPEAHNAILLIPAQPNYQAHIQRALPISSLFAPYLPDNPIIVLLPRRRARRRRIPSRSTRGVRLLRRLHLDIIALAPVVTLARAVRGRRLAVPPLVRILLVGVVRLGVVLGGRVAGGRAAGGPAGAAEGRVAGAAAAARADAGEEEEDEEGAEDDDGEDDPARPAVPGAVAAAVAVDVVAAGRGC